MTVLYHPAFAGDIRRFATQYAAISPKLNEKFRRDVDAALVAIVANPGNAGHFVNTGSVIVRDIRRRNLETFPFFVLYGVVNDRLIFGSLIPSASDPQSWLARFE